MKTDKDLLGQSGNGKDKPDANDESSRTRDARQSLADAVKERKPKS
jgi:hypothetical protein